MPQSERELDLCLMKTLPRKVQERGCVEFERLIYTASLRRDENGCWQHDMDANFLKDYEGRKKVTIRYNPTNIVYILVYTLEENDQPSEFLGTLRARDLEEERLSLKEWKDRKKKMRDEGKEIDQSSILAQQRDLYTSSIEQVKTLKQRRKKENTRIIRNSDHADKVVELHPPKTASSRAKSKSKNVAPATEPPVLEGLELTQESSEIQVKPALYVVSDWNEFVKDGW